jgi:hypothetical protein
MTVNQLIEKLQECDPGELVKVEREPLDPLGEGFKVVDWDDYVFVVGVEFEDDDSEESREQGRNKYGRPYLRAPILLVNNEG